MAPRITLNLTPGGELQIRLNEEGRDLFVRELLALKPTSEHVHMGTYEGAELRLSSRPYRSTDEIIHAAKVLFRLDEWDAQYFPHVMVAES
jgi:hypothetical protein